MKTSAIISTAISWFVVIVIALGIPVLNHYSDRITKLQQRALSTGKDWQFEFMGKYSLGAARAFQTQNQAMIRQMLDTAKNDEQEIAAAIVEAELNGKDAAIRTLRGIDDHQAEEMIEYYNGDDRGLRAKTFASHYPWFHRLAAQFGKSDMQTRRAEILSQADWMFRGAFIFIVFMLFIGSVGFLLLILAIILLATGKLQFRTQRVERGEVYIESFAIYLGLFMAVSFAMTLLPKEFPLAVKLIPMCLIVLFAASWPLMREVKFADYRKTIGAHMGRGLIPEVFFGIVGYIAGLPLVLFGMMITYILMRFTHEQSNHPITFEITEMSPLLLYGLAAVFAPLAEELMFRGIFVSHLRSWSGVFVSAAVSGLIFASIHPQGWVAIPVLGTMGANFALIRQWRDSLIPSITAHALNNGAVITLMLLIIK